MCLYDNGEFEKVSITQGDINKNVVLYNRNSIIEQTERIVEEMKQKNLKFSEESILFATKDKNGNILWLEKGNDSGGLNHIIYGSRINKTIGHKNDYLSLHGVTPDEIPYDIYRMVSSGTIIHEKKIIKKGKPGIERVYYKDGRFYLCCGIGTNGYIVSAYPIDEERYKEIKRRSIK